MIDHFFSLSEALFFTWRPAGQPPPRGLSAGPCCNAFCIFFYELKHCLALAQGHIGNLVRALRHGIAGLSARGSRVVNPKLESFK